MYYRYFCLVVIFSSTVLFSGVLFSCLDKNDLIKESTPQTLSSESYPTCEGFDADGDLFPVCKGSFLGVQDCNDADPAISPGSLEICYDDKDNDCDQKIDLNDDDCKEICRVPHLCEGKGVCGNIYQKCVGGQLQCLYELNPLYEPKESFCLDNLDNDCDGSTDSKDSDCLQNTQSQQDSIDAGDTDTGDQDHVVENDQCPGSTCTINGLTDLPLGIRICDGNPSKIVKICSSCGEVKSEKCGESTQCIEGNCVDPNSITEPYCGDKTCNGTETCAWCAADCGICGCGKNGCETGESCELCPTDCGICPSVCGKNGCEQDKGENCSNCEQDCGKCGPNCGVNGCETGETCGSCLADCPCPAISGWVCGNSGTCEFVQTDPCANINCTVPNTICKSGLCVSKTCGDPGCTTCSCPGCDGFGCSPDYNSYHCKNLTCTPDNPCANCPPGDNSQVCINNQCVPRVCTEGYLRRCSTALCKFEKCVNNAWGSCELYPDYYCEPSCASPNLSPIPCFR